MTRDELIAAYAAGKRDFSGAYLSEANLSGANLSEAYLRWANLSGANLAGANLAGANLHRANLHGANLHGANLRGADLSGATSEYPNTPFQWFLATIGACDPAREWAGERGMVAAYAECPNEEWKAWLDAATGGRLL